MLMDDVKIYNLDRRYADLFDKEDMIPELDIFILKQMT